MKFQTSASKFKIGGVTIYTLDEAPDNTLGVQGDVFIRTDDPSMFVKKTNNAWELVQNATTPDFGFTGSRGEVGFVGSRGPLGYTGSIGFTGSRGEDGTGSTINLIGTVATVNDLPSSGNEDGDAYTVAGDLYVYDAAGAEFVNIGSILGPRGFTGSKGFTGSIGFAGSIGFTGSQGESGTGTTIDLIGTVATVNDLPSSGNEDGDAYNVNGDLYVYDAAGAEFVNVGNVQGPTGFTGSKGDDGTSVTILGTLSSTNDLPASGNTTGDGYLINGDLHVWDGTSWNNVGQIQGPTGFTGSRGFTGSIGFAGSKGDIGPTGFTGSRGFTGSQGTTGFTGSKGDVGSLGFTGSRGFTGSIGFTGSKGDVGSLGFTGSRGFTGSIGFTGSQGIQGEGAQVTLFNVNNSFSVTPSTSNSIVYTSPNTAGVFQIIESIYATNISSSEQTFTCFISYNYDNTVINSIPIPVGSSVEIIKKPKVLPPNTNIRMSASSSSSVNVVGSFRSNEEGDFIGGGNNFTSSNYTDVFTVSNTLGVELSSVLLASSSNLDTSASVIVTNSVNTIQYYLSNDIIVPANGSIELLNNPKFMNNAWKLRVATTDEVSVIYSGINIT